MIRKRKRNTRKVSKVHIHRKRAVRKTVQRLHNHPEPLVSIIIPAMNEKATLPDVLREAGRVHPRSEIIVIANGSTDGTPEVARRLGAKLIVSETPLGHDVGRRIGASVAKGSILLFIDADMVIPAKQLRPYVDAVVSGVDVALNGYSGPTAKKKSHPVVVAKYVLNAWMLRPDLQGTSMTAIPHALSRRALDVIGLESLEIPPLAQAKAVAWGLNVQAVHTVPVGRLNPIRRKNGDEDILTSLVAGDHLEALHWLIQHRGVRGGFDDLGRLRDKVR
ncbi:Glycosyl transferase family 2 [Fontibacillus panacisegetis]|uniref:Glycosyl transferase family 2 n=1 Tax=Fontibacillus panacisegetis TaxID=670482 RepID=A0A1G7JWU0_9BACL|nr:glycosyltransferase [Fontibacillus panacisegetis]SDF29396.1 Glycosyl transferase family 2 [Fontibacillus panacisegetis]